MAACTCVYVWDVGECVMCVQTHALIKNTRRLIPLSLLEHQLQIFGAFGWSTDSACATIKLTINIAAGAKYFPCYRVLRIKLCNNLLET